MSHLLRSHAPITEAGWKEVDEEAAAHLRAALGARKLVDFAGPLGWKHSATTVGRVMKIAGPASDLEAGRREVLPLVELRAPFSVSRSELLDIERGSIDPDLSELDSAARKIAEAENVAIFQGWQAAGIQGIAEASVHPPVQLGKDFAHYPKHVAKAVQVLLTSGVDGPFGIALSPEDYRGVLETAEHGPTVFDHLREILAGPIVYAPGVNGAVVVSQRGDDFLFESGEDLSIGYDHHDADQVHLYIEESFSFRVATPEAGVALVP